MAITFKHQTGGQFAARFWRRIQDAFKSGNKPEFCRLIWWIYQRIQAGDFTSNEVRLSYNAFFGKSLNTTQWNTLVTTRFSPARDRWQAILDEGQI
jgi:hypothetical protein